jgi:hypothetical protein
VARWAVEVQVLSSACPGSRLVGRLSAFLFACRYGCGDLRGNTGGNSPAALLPKARPQPIRLNLYLSFDLPALLGMLFPLRRKPNENEQCVR